MRSRVALVGLAMVVAGCGVSASDGDAATEGDDAALAGDDAAPATDDLAEAPDLAKQPRDLAIASDLRPPPDLAVKPLRPKPMIFWSQARFAGGGLYMVQLP